MTNGHVYAVHRDMLGTNAMQHRRTKVVPLTVMYVLDKSRQVAEDLAAVLPLTGHRVRLLVLSKHACLCGHGRSRPRRRARQLTAVCMGADVLVVGRVGEVCAGSEAGRGRGAVVTSGHLEFACRGGRGRKARGEE